tara:strand:- start:917 stop:1351 length:435 start_codon:yes stop_codon:yes gene_type:complete
MKTIFKTAQIGGKGTVRRKMRKKKQIHKNRISYHEQKLTKLINQFNQFEIIKEHYTQYNEYCNLFIEKKLQTFTKKYFNKKQIIENIQEFIKDNLLLCENNKKNKFIIKYSDLSLYLSEKGINSLIDCYFDLWDNVNTKQYLEI